MTENSNLFTVKCVYFTDCAVRTRGGGVDTKSTALDNFVNYAFACTCTCAVCWRGTYLLEGSDVTKHFDSPSWFWWKKKMNTGSILSACENSLLYPPSRSATAFSTNLEGIRTFCLLNKCLKWVMIETTYCSPFSNLLLFWALLNTPLHWLYILHLLNFSVMQEVENTKKKWFPRQSHLKR